MFTHHLYRFPASEWCSSAQQMEPQATWLLISEKQYGEGQDKNEKKMVDGDGCMYSGGINV